MKRTFCFAVASIAAFAATPASAQAVSKTEAILGGPSRLAALMAMQSSGGEASTAALLDTPVAALVRPAIVSTGTPIVAPANPDRPDVFGSVALPVRQSSLDARWAAVAESRVGGAAAMMAAALRDDDEIDRVEAINRFVNSRVQFADDQQRYGVADRWNAAATTMATGRGDCEDYAIAKMAMLRAAGIDDENLYLVILKDLSRRADHAVLVVRTGGRFLVLDNGTDRLIDSDEIRDYRPILTFTRGRAYTHGYRRNVRPEVQMASVEVTAPVRPAAAPMDSELATLAAANLPAALSATFAR